MKRTRDDFLIFFFIVVSILCQLTNRKERNLWSRKKPVSVIACVNCFVVVVNCAPAVSYIVVMVMMLAFSLV